VAVPDIGTTISDGYGRGLERIASVAAPAAVPAVFVGIAAGLLGEIAAHTSSSALGGLLNAAISALFLLVGFTVLAVFAGDLHRARHGAVVAPIDPAALPARMVATLPDLLPNVGILAGLAVLGPMFGIISGTLGGLVSLAAAVGAVWLSVRWFYAPVLAGAGETTGPDAFDRSARVVDPEFWPTFVVVLVAGLAVGAPVALVALVVSAIIGVVFSTIFVTWLVVGTILTVGIAVFWAPALESAWHQVEDAPPGSSTPEAPITGVAPITPAIVDVD